MYRIKKTSLTRAIAGKIVNVFNQSKSNTYSCDYINNNFPPAGTIMAFAGSSSHIPTGWIICDGSAVSRTSYSNLFSVIGTTYGEGDGSTTFNLPNLKGRVPVGVDSSQTEFNARGKTGGSKEMQRHTHPVGINGGTNSGSKINFTFGSDQRIYTPSTDGDIIGFTGTGNSGNLQPYIAVNYIIKY